MHPNRKGYISNLYDKYYTKPEVVKKCLEQIEKLPYNYDCIIEPSAGNGAFYDQIEHPNKIGMDIEPDHKEIIKQDWMKYRIDKQYKCVLIVGNPPFGQYHKLSSSFILHSLFFNNVQTIAFILPNVYKKHTRQKILPMHWRIHSITNLEKDSFISEGQEYHVPTSFFIFDKSNGKDLRVNPNQYKETADFTFGSNKDFDIFVFGAAPKRITTNPKPNNRGYYLKSKISVKDLIKKIRNVNWKGNSCANGGVYWLTKHEFLEQYINCYERNRTEKNNSIYS